MLNLLSNVETSLYEIQMLNYKYENIQLRNFPFGGDIIFVRIIRNNESIVPHGRYTIAIWRSLNCYRG